MDAACLNCGTELTGEWCSNCGQKVTHARPTLHELLHDAMHELAHFDGKILRTAGMLLFKPGALTREFVDGKRVRSVTPIRVYLLCSLLFFGTLGLLPTGKLRVSVTKGADAQLEQAAAQVNKDPSILAHALQSAFPKAMFALMPLFALIVFAFYRRAEPMYVPHFYFSVHYHAFVFVLLTLFEVLGLIRHWMVGIARLLMLLVMFVYLAIALRRVYGGRRWMTAAKTAGIVPIYGAFVLLAMAMIAYVTLRRL